MLLYLTRVYPARSAIVLLCRVVAGTLGGLDFSARLPLSSLANGAPNPVDASGRGAAASGWGAW